MPPTLDTIWEALVTGFWNLIAALVIFVISIYIARILSGIVRRMLNNRKIPVGVAQLFSHLTLWAIIISGLVLALQRFFDVTAFLAGLGIAGLAIGFALQDIMKNLAAGVVLLVQQPFHVGESIGVKGFEGTITAIDLRATEMRATDGRMIILPNADVLVNPIINFSRTRQRKVELNLNLPLTSEPDTTRRILIDTIQGVSGVLHEPEPDVVFVNMTDSAIQLNFSFWVDVNQIGTDHARDAVLLKIKSAFNQEGIEIPHPIQAVYSRS